MKLLLERREENIKGFIRGKTSYNQFLATPLPEKTGQFYLKLQSISIQAIRGQT